MIAADTSTGLRFCGAGDDTQLLDKSLDDRQVVMVPVVLAELLSDPSFRPMLRRTSPRYR